MRAGALLSKDHAACSINNILCDSTSCLQDTTLPAFDKIKAEHVVPGIRELLAQLNADIDALEQNVVPTWAGLVEPIERIFDRLERAWGAVSHLKVRHITHLMHASPHRARSSCSIATATLHLANLRYE
jgi:Zn-dependent oligopeptidase